GVATATVTVIPTLPGILTNSTSLSGSGVDLNPADNATVVLTTAKAVTDLALNGSGSPQPAPFSQSVVYTWTATNRGPNPAASVRITSAPLDGMSFVSAISSQGTCANVGG